MPLVGFIIGKYGDARSPERQVARSQPWNSLAYAVINWNLFLVVMAC